MVSTSEFVRFASDAGIGIDDNLRIVAWNERAQTLLGYRPEEVLGQLCSNVLHAVLPDDQPLCSPDCDPQCCFAHRQPYWVETCRIQHKDGHWVPLSVGTMIVPYAGGDGVMITYLLLRPQPAAAATPAVQEPLTPAAR